MKKLCLLLVMMFMLTGCGAIRILNPFNRTTPPSKAEYIQTHNYEFEYYQDKKDGVTIKTIKKSSEKAVPKVTLGQRIAAWFAGAGTLTIILIAAGLFFAPSATISILLWSRAKIGRALSETVRAIKISSAVRESEKLHNALAAEQSVTTKKIVNNIKSEV